MPRDMIGRLERLVQDAPAGVPQVEVAVVALAHARRGEWQRASLRFEQAAARDVYWARAFEVCSLLGG